MRGSLQRAQAKGISRAKAIVLLYNGVPTFPEGRARDDIASISLARRRRRRKIGQLPRGVVKIRDPSFFTQSLKV